LTVRKIGAERSQGVYGDDWYACAESSEKNAGFPDFPTRSEVESGWVCLKGCWDGLGGGLADEKMVYEL